MTRVAIYKTFRKKSNKSSRIYAINQMLKYTNERNYKYTIYIDIVNGLNELKLREMLKKLKKDIIDNKFNKVIIDSLSNLSKNRAFTLEFLQFLKENNCTLESIREGKIFYDTYINYLKETDYRNGEI